MGSKNETKADGPTKRGMDLVIHAEIEISFSICGIFLYIHVDPALLNAIKHNRRLDEWKEGYYLCCKNQRKQ